jgi:hypothetical protein
MLRNTSPLCKLLALAALVTSLALTVGSEVAWAQQPQPTQPVFQFTYFANGRQALDGHVRIVNGGSNASSSGIIPNGDLCANIYVLFKENMLECCSCLVTTDGGLQLSINHDLTSNPFKGAAPTNGVIKLISTVPQIINGGEVCETPVLPLSDTNDCPGTGAGSNNRECPTPELGAWATHVQAQLPNQSFPVSEEEFWPATLSDSEVFALDNECAAIGSGIGSKGTCTCGTTF